MLGAMDTNRVETGHAPAAETDDDRRRRIAWEAAMIAEADAELEAGLFIDSADVDAWIDSIGTDHELPVPSPRR
jgi:predicted transcriptional regulator